MEAEVMSKPVGKIKKKVKKWSARRRARKRGRKGMSSETFARLVDGIKSTQIGELIRLSREKTKATAQDLEAIKARTEQKAERARIRMSTKLALDRAGIMDSAKRQRIHKLVWKRKNRDDYLESRAIDRETDNPLKWMEDQLAIELGGVRKRKKFLREGNKIIEEFRRLAKELREQREAEGEDLQF